MKTWRVSDPCTCNEEDFETEEEALAFAQELLAGHREEAKSEGEWAEETGLLRVYELKHLAKISEEGIDEDGFNWADYAICKAT